MFDGVMTHNARAQVALRCQNLRHLQMRRRFFPTKVFPNQPLVFFSFATSFSKTATRFSNCVASIFF
jgi:hypothetical protein